MVVLFSFHAQFFFSIITIICIKEVNHLLLKGKVYHSYMEVLLGDGIFNVDGESWRKQRKTASFEFASKNLRDFSTVVFREYSLKLSSVLSQASFCNKEVDMQVNNGFNKNFISV